MTNKDPRSIVGKALRGPGSEIVPTKQTEAVSEENPLVQEEAQDQGADSQIAEQKSENPAATKDKEPKDEWVQLGTEIPKGLSERLDTYLEKPGAMKTKKLAVSKALEMFLDKAELAQKEYEKTMANMGF